MTGRDSGGDTTPVRRAHDTIAAGRGTHDVVNLPNIITFGRLCENNPASDAVSAPEGSPNQLRSRETEKPATGSLSPMKP